jgi:hypothetical protein
MFIVVIKQLFILCYFLAKLVNRPVDGASEEVTGRALKKLGERQKEKGKRQKLERRSIALGPTFSFCLFPSAFS